MYSFLKYIPRNRPKNAGAFFGLFITCISFSALDAPPQHKSSHEK